MTPPQVAVVTLAHGRHAHLEAQLDALSCGSRRPDSWVVAAMDDPGIGRIVSRDHGDTPAAATMVTVAVPRSDGHLPLAAARNIAASTAIELGADVLVFLDVDCIPSPRLVERYVDACWPPRSHPDGGPHPVVLSGAVHYLPPLPPGQPRYSAADLDRSTPHPVRRVAADGRCVVEPDPGMFWSLSFALTSTDWQALGGFDEGYVGYGGEDTDFAMRVHAGGGLLYRLGGAPAYHQHHPVEDPPRRHVSDIIRNSNRFHDRWGIFPMRGWLDAFADEGLIRLSGQPPRWTSTSSVGRPSRTS